MNIVGSQDDMQIFDAPHWAYGLTTPLVPSNLDVLVLCCEKADLQKRGEAFFRSHPLLTIVTFDSDGRQFYFYGPQPLMIPLGEVSPKQLVDAIREAARPAS